MALPRLTFRGLAIEDGGDIEFDSITGLDTMRSDAGVSSLPQNHGAVPMEGHARPVDITIDLRVVNNLAASRLAIQEAFQLTEDEHPLLVEWPDEDPYIRYCRCVRREVERVRGREHVEPGGRVDLLPSDPARYSADLTQATVDPFTLSGGLSYPVTYPKIYGTAGSGGGVTIENVGNWPTWPRFIISGPTSGAVNVLAIEDVTHGNIMSFTADGGLTVSEGSTLVIDSHPARRVVAFTSGASRLNTLVDLDSWFSLPAGESEIRFRASGDTAGASLTVESRSAWL